ncbi:LysM peptidoglycan-binding domain-containing protein [Paenibacillus rhizoplanae]
MRHMQQYIARRGDTVSRIAARHGLTPEHVIQGNPWAGSQPYLYPGQVLQLPSAPRKRYAVQRGTMYTALRPCSVWA